jgi:two-component system, sensor histidine kinase and response regulator
MKTLPVVEWITFLKLRDLQPPDEPDIIEELVSAFLVDSAKRLARLLDAAAAGDLRIVAHEAHSIKGSAGLLGAEALEAEAQEVETAARAGGSSTLPDLIDRLAAIVRATQVALTQGPPPA